MVEDFVRGGGVFISTVGYDGVGPSKAMLANLGFSIGQRPEDERLGREPQPLGYFKAPFFNGGKYMAYVRFFAGWRVICDDPDRLVISQYPTGEELIVMRRLGKGLIVVVGDTFFATNKKPGERGGRADRRHARECRLLALAPGAVAERHGRRTVLDAGRK